jgi:hypothetical protein
LFSNSSLARGLVSKTWPLIERLEVLLGYQPSQIKPAITKKKKKKKKKVFVFLTKTG